VQLLFYLVAGVLARTAAGRTPTMIGFFDFATWLGHVDTPQRANFIVAVNRANSHCPSQLA
jgi:hypothetical protein